MPDYLITWVDYALEQYLALPEPTRSRVDDALRMLAADPTGAGRYDPATDRWSLHFDTGQGLVVYIVNDDNRRVVILRILHMG